MTPYDHVGTSVSHHRSSGNNYVPEIIDQQNHVSSFLPRPTRNDILPHHHGGTSAPESQKPSRSTLFTVFLKGISPWRQHQKGSSSLRGISGKRPPSRTIDSPCSGVQRRSQGASDGEGRLCEASISMKSHTSSHSAASGPSVIIRWFPRLPARRVAMPTCALLIGTVGSIDRQ